MSIVMQINPFEFFVDTAGTALDAGYIYIGEANTDPRNYPVAVFYDEALTIPAAMPLRTTNGYIYRNGSPTYLYIDGNYSIRVEDKNHRLVFYVPDFLMIGSGQAVSLSDLTNTTDPTKGISIIPTASRLVNTIADLMLLPKTGGSISVFVQGYYAKGDAGGGNYYLDQADTTSVHNGGTIIVANDGGRWKLTQAGPVSIKQFGAKGDWDGLVGQNDTPFIQAAINWAQASHQTIKVPAVAQGLSYQVTAPLTITRGVSIVGDDVEPFVGLLSTSGVNTRGAGSWFHLNHVGKGFIFDGGATGASGGVLKQIGTLRNQPTPIVGGVFGPNGNDWDIDVSRFDVLVQDVMLLNPTNAIIHRDGSFGRLTCERVRGQPLSVGINLDETYDVCRLIDIHWWPFWSNVDSVQIRTSSQAVAFSLGRVDNPIMRGCFAIFYRIFIRIVTHAAGPVSFLDVSGCGADATETLIEIAANQPTVTISDTYQFGTTLAAARALIIGTSAIDWISGNNGNLILSNVRMSQVSKSIIKMFNGINRIQASNIEMGNWAVSTPGDVGIDIQGNGNVFEMAGPPRITSVIGGSGAAIGGAGIPVATVRFPLTNGFVNGALTDASGDITITIIDNKVAPRKASAMATGTAPYQFSLRTTTPTTIQFRVFNASGVALINTAVFFSWFCEF